MENNIDFQVDETLEKCILSTPRKSFFLFAGAGSGKTYSLVLLLKKIRNSIGKELLLQGKNVAVITFTNAATDEIINRLDYSSIFQISTIHSFVWDVIKYYQTDIKRLYCQYIIEDIEALNKKMDETKNKTTKTYFSNVEKFNHQKERLAKAQTIEKFVYNPNGSNPEYNALKHTEVIKISAQMIIENKMLQRIIAQQYPILLIDESQDTKKELIDAFFEIQRNFANIFTLGLLGDQKQRIYADGKENIEGFIPAGWEKPIKKMNYRSAKRIIQLANIIGKDDFLEVFVSTPLEECEKRDVKGLYAKARKGEIQNFTGISAPFEVPEHPALSLDTSKLTLEESVNRLLELVLPKVKCIK